MTRQVLTDVSGIARLCELGYRESMVFPDLIGSLPAQIHGAGFQLEYGPSYNGNNRNPSKAGLAAIRYTLSGGGRIRYDGQQILVGPGQALLLYFPYDHHYWIESGEQWEFFYITLAGREVISCIREVSDNVGPVVTLSANSPTLACAAAACADALEQKIQSPYRGSVAAHAILMRLLDECRPPAQAPTCGLPAVHAFVLEVEEYCRRNYARPIHVADLARVAKMSRFHFTRLFQRAWGLSPGRFLSLVRLEHAMRMLREGGFTIKELAQQCGFGTANYFTKVFRKHYGVTPGGFNVDRFMLRPLPPTANRQWSGELSHVVRTSG